MTFPPPPPQGQYPAAPPPYPGGSSSLGEKPPNGGAAITAGVLACIGAVFGLIRALNDFSSLGERALDLISDLKWIVWLEAITSVAEVVTLLPGGILLFLRKPIGRWLVAAGSAVRIVVAIIVFSKLISLVGNVSVIAGPTSAGRNAGMLFAVLSPAIAALVLSLLPVTGRWCAWGKKTAQGTQLGSFGVPPGGAPGYAQQQYPYQQPQQYQQPPNQQQPPQQW
ncbi:hypothetical protein [Amycolatopsis sp. CA-230715]|uniref:hypothetical protein n=1 Tax=Amycolatopsis sp. CA-230715 TaxID=2745196 RepID=UPI001C02B002|nr:hypothetical protein [Amycolatopsis sp. CA-230715]QWF85483.1 hypothetical protein HUW46_08937 [Amycolatopsis sp. CA-230715]